MDDCVAEAQWLASEGVKELIVVAQDPTAYGEDWGKPGSICTLLDRLNAIEGIEWIRILYAYPSGSPTTSSPPCSGTRRFCLTWTCPSSTATTRFSAT